MISAATTPKPLPASPAAVASMVALRASRLVCRAMAWMVPVTWVISAALRSSAVMVSLARSARPRASAVRRDPSLASWATEARELLTASTARLTESTEALAALAEEEMPLILTEICSEAEEMPLTLTLTSSAAPAMDWMVELSSSAPAATVPAWLVVSSAWLINWLARRVSLPDAPVTPSEPLRTS